MGPRRTAHNNDPTMQRFDISESNPLKATKGHSGRREGVPEAIGACAPHFNAKTPALWSTPVWQRTALFRTLLWPSDGYDYYVTSASASSIQNSRSETGLNQPPAASEN